LAYSAFSSAPSRRICGVLVLFFALLALPFASQARAAQTVVSFTFDDGIKTQFDLARPLLNSHGMNGTFYVNSGNCGYASARWVGGIRDASDCSNCPYAETLPPANAYTVNSSPYVTGAITLARLQGWVTQAEQHGGGWVPLMFHDICNACYDASVSQTVFGQFLDWLQPRSANGTVVKTVRDALATTPPPADTTPPTTSITCNNATCTSTALSAPVTIRLSATDNSGGSGVASTRYTTNGSDPTTSSTAYTGPFTISSTTTIKYRSWDVAGNAEAVRTQTVNVSSGAARSVVITSPANGATVSGNVTVVANVTGSWSIAPNVDLYVDSNWNSYRNNGTNPYTIPWNATASGKGTHKLEIEVIEASTGNTVDSPPITVTVSG
jgi:hypothetical protein